ncbi:unnamed protein product [Amoebophrya sp. A120]|nr:unnamed protein product [Amoebophrya sp. A120]|eukprot:GSA120T00008600001.1
MIWRRAARRSFIVGYFSSGQVERGQKEESCKTGVHRWLLL